MKHALTFGETHFEVDPLVGGRITAFRLDGNDVLSGPDVDDQNYGSTFWTSPQRDWGWPPPFEVDREPYHVAATDDSLTLTSSTRADLGVRITKRFAVDGAKSAVVLEYEIENVSSAPRAYAPWEVSRVAAGGLTFFRTGAWAAGRLPVERCGAATWFMHDPTLFGREGHKVTADGAGGFLAHVANGLLFVKSFVDVPPERQAPGEGEIEIYANDRYVEVEVQGPYTTIPPGASASWAVTWLLRRLPSGVDSSPRSEGLLAFAEDVARSEVFRDAVRSARVATKPKRGS